MRSRSTRQLVCEVIVKNNADMCVTERRYVQISATFTRQYQVHSTNENLTGNNIKFKEICKYVSAFLTQPRAKEFFLRFLLFGKQSINIIQRTKI